MWGECIAYIQYNHKFLLICISKESGSIVGMDFKFAGLRRIEHKVRSGKFYPDE